MKKLFIITTGLILLFSTIFLYSQNYETEIASGIGETETEIIAYYCTHITYKKDLTIQYNDEIKYAKEYGVADLSRLNELKNYIRMEDISIKMSSMKYFKLMKKQINKNLCPIIKE